MQNTNHIVNNINKQIVAVKSEPPPLPTTDPAVLQPVQATPTPASIDNQLTLDEKKFDLNKLEHQNSFDNDLEKTLANLQPIANEFAAFEKDQEKIFQELVPLNDIKPTIDSCNPDKIHFNLSSTNQEVLTVNENSKQVLANSVKKSSPTVSCDLCNKNFSSPSKLRRHVRIVHEKIKPFNCQECGKNFGQKVNLIGHIQSRHKPNLDTTNNQDQQHQKQQSTIITIPVTNTTTSSEGTIIQEIISEKEVHDQNNTVNVEVNHASSVNQEVNNQEIHHNTVNVVNQAVNHAVSAMSVNAIVVENPGPEKMQQITATASVTTNNSNKKVFKCMECVFDSEDSGDMISHHLSTHVQTMFNFDTSELLLE